MANFSIRVELHHSDAYEKLHKHMEAQGFERTITSDSGVTSHMPPGMYRYDGNTDANAVWQAAVNALETAGLVGAVFVDRTVHTVWSGLATVTANSNITRVGW